MRKITTLIPFVLGTAMVMSFAVGADETDKAAEYFSEYYNVEPFEKPNAENVNALLEALGAEPIPEGEFTDGKILVSGMRIAGLEELALTYSKEDAVDKTAAILEGEDLAALNVEEEYAPYLACAIDQGLLDINYNDAEEFLYKCAEVGGRGRHYIGRVSDPDIMSVLQSTLKSFVIFDEAELTNLGTEIVLSGATTGYNLKYAGYDANFLADYTLKYGHSDYTHAVQLIGLLKSEGMDAYIQIEPKVSVYEYMLDWGEPGEPTPTYAVKQVTEDRYLAYAVEYDMLLEFDTREEKEKFHDIIELYAKKYDDSLDADGNVVEKLLAGSWWQPLYSSTTEMQNEEFGTLIDNVVYDEEGNYSIHPFSLPENAEAIAEKVAEVAPELEVSPVTIYVNPAFMRYITGESYQ